MAGSDVARMTPPLVQAAVRRDDTILRLGGDCYASAITWSTDDRQIVTLIDSSGWPEIPPDHYWCTSTFVVDGDPRQATFHDVSTYPDVNMWDMLKGGPMYYGFGTLAVGESIYQFLSTENSLGDGPATGDLYAPNVFKFTSAKLIFSPDNGRVWCNHDGSTPVTLEPRHEQSPATTTFFNESNEAFAQLSFLQMGKGYEDNVDGYVYVYGPNGSTEGTMNELVMFRVPKDAVVDRDAYEYFGGTQADGSPVWVKDIAERAVVHTFPSGWVPEIGPLAWLPSVVYNRALGVYLMANSSGISADCIATRPTYLGFWVAPNPWGPWTQVHEETAWLPGDDPAARAAAPQIPPKWIAPDGKSFWLVWTDVQEVGDFGDICSIFDAKTNENRMEDRIRWRKHHPYFAFNAQRVDLVVR